MELVTGWGVDLSPPTGRPNMLDFDAELESAKLRISEIQKSIVSQMRLLRFLSGRGMDKTMGERMLNVRRHYLGRTTAHVRLIESRIATRLQLERIAERSSGKALESEKAMELEPSLGSP
jgi:hypothetical protein